jgi:hypothetical protein
MKLPGPAAYHRVVIAARWRRGLAGLLAVFAFCWGMRAPAHAQSTLISTTGSPFVWVSLDHGTITVHSWNRSQISLIADPTIRYNLAPPRLAARMPLQIPLWSASVETRAGPMNLPQELFPLPEFAPGEHDALVVRGSGNVTLFVPAQAPLVVANVQGGNIDLGRYIGTAFVAHVVTGRVHIANSSTTAAVQVDDGPITIASSSFLRARLRTGRGAISMNDCRAAQIQVTSLAGNILYDDGFFDPGLAHFESELGNIAIGLASPAQIEASSGTGRVFDMLGGGGEGPVVTAASAAGAVMMFRGALRDYPDLLRVFAPRANTYASPPYRV